MTIVEMRVHMDCPGCESRIKKTLKKLDGADDIHIDMAMQKVRVKGWADQRKILKTVRKTGRKVELWPFPCNPNYHNFTHYYLQNYNQSHQITYYAPQPSSSYNYCAQGHNDHNHCYYNQRPRSTLLDERTRSIFSDENPHACSIM